MNSFIISIHCNEYLAIFTVCKRKHDDVLFIVMNSEELGNLIRKRRGSLQVDQKALSEISGIAVHTLSNIEAGNGNPTVETLNRVLAALGMELHVQIRQ
jgi:DNA-binding phage protein